MESTALLSCFLVTAWLCRVSPLPVMDSRKNTIVSFSAVNIRASTIDV